MKSNLRKIISDASKKDYTIAGYNVFGYEDAVSVIHAAEKGEFPVLLMINRLSSQHMDIANWANLLLPLAEEATVPVGIHLDHCYDASLVKRALECGFTSVMYDGSQLSLDENIYHTSDIVDYAKKFDACVEGEIGSVPYSDINKEIQNRMTDVEEAVRFEKESGVDWMEISVGNIHRLQQKIARIDFELLERIENATNIPLVIHGASGIVQGDMDRLVKHRVGKINIGTQLRVAYVGALREEMKKNPNEYDMIKLVQKPMKCVEKEVECCAQMTKLVKAM